MKTRRYYISYGIGVAVILGLTLCFNHLNPSIKTAVKGLTLFTFVGILTSVVRIHYTYAILDYLKKTDNAAYEFSKKTMFMLRFNYDSSYPYSSDTKNVLEDYNMFCTWITLGLVAFTLFLIFI